MKAMTSKDIILMALEALMPTVCMTTQDIKWQGNDPDNLDDSSSLDGTYRPSHLSQDEVSNSYPSSRTKDRDWHKHQSHSSNQT